jgi:glycolate oxidase FAD binding subunit
MSATTAVVIPTDAAECARVLEEAARDRRSVRVAGGMSKSYLGELRATDVELRTTRISGIVDHVPADLTVTVHAGMRLAELSEALRGAGQFLPLDPPHGEAATVGGIIAANSNGFWRSRYGAVRDLLIGTRAALADGTVVRGGGRVVKNVAGYDLNKLWTGSLGTLGVLIEATFKVLPVPAASDGVVVAFARGADAFAAAETLARAPARPEACVVHRDEERRWTLVFTARGGPATVARAMADAQRESAARRGEVRSMAAELADLRELPARAVDGALVRAALPLAAQSAYADTAARLETLATLVADAASGVVRAHLRGDDDAVLRDAEALVVATRVIGGSGRVERRAESLRSRLPTWSTRPNGDFLMRRIKDAFDPAGILEPGRSAIA